MEPIKPEHLFSNGTEYMSFLEVNCLRCKKFVHPDDATEENPCCPIEEAIALAGCGIDEGFPWDKLTENGYMHRYDCADFEAKGANTNE